MNGEHRYITMTMKEENHQPVAVLGQNDLSALVSVLSFYERWLQHTLALSAKRSRQITEVHVLLVKMSLLGTMKGVMLTVDDVEHITSALRVFSAHVRDKIPASKDRDGVLESCEGLRNYIATTFAPPRKQADD